MNDIINESLDFKRARALKYLGARYVLSAPNRVKRLAPKETLEAWLYRLRTK